MATTKNSRSNNKSTVVTLRVPNPVYEKMKRLAAQKDTSVNLLARQYLIEQYQ